MLEEQSTRVRPPAGLLKRTVRSAAVRYGAPLIRAYMQNPIHWGKMPFWKAVGQKFFWQKHAFTTTTEFGAIIHGDTEDLIQAAIYYFGIWEPHLTRFIQERLRVGDVFVDVGANIGYYSLCASKLVGATGSVVAVEASPSIYRRLLSHLAENRADNVRPLHVAASHEVGELAMYSGPDRNIGTSTTVVAGNQDITFECNVPAAPLETLLTESEKDRVRLIKIDVEGAEWAVTQGMCNMLASCRKDVEIVMEVSPERLTAQGQSPAQILDFFRSLGFHAYLLENDYSPMSYVPPVARRPILRVNDVTEQTDIVFSRRSQARL